MINNIYFNRRQKVLINVNRNDEKRGILLERYIATLLRNIESFGYTFSERLIKELNYMNKIEFLSFYNEILGIIKEFVGDNSDTKPMYANFPKELMSIRESEVYMNSLKYYLSNGKVKPEYEKHKRGILNENIKLKIIDLGSREDFNAIFNNLLSSKESLSETDKADIEWFVANLDNVRGFLPNEIKFKEILTYITPLLISREDEYLLFQYKSATDVLMLATSMSGGDISLSANSKFRSFSRKERKLILTLLENCSNIEEDMKRHKERWIRLGERLHPGEYKRFKKVNEAFYKIRNNIQIESFASKLEALYKEENLEGILDLLSERPDEFGRGLDRILRLSCKLEKSKNDKKVNRILEIISNLDYDINDDLSSEFESLKGIAKDKSICGDAEILKSFEQVACNIPSRLLLQIREHFKFRYIKGRIRVFQPKGGYARTFARADNLCVLSQVTCEEIIRICEESLKSIYSRRKPLNKVYIDENLKNFIVPMSQGNKSKGLKTATIGSRVMMNEESKAILNTIKPNIFDLIRLNAESRGEIVDSKEKADIIFSVDEGITPYDVDILMTEFL